MPRKKITESQLPQGHRSPQATTVSTPPSTTEDQSINGATAGDEAAAHPPIDEPIINFTPANRSSVDQRSTADQPPRQSVERLASLNLNNRGSSRPSVATQSPGPAEQIKKLKFQPKSSARRSKEEREATERAEAERLNARLAAADTSSSNPTSRGGLQNRGTARDSWSGVPSRWQSERFGSAGAAGFLGGATPAEDKRRREAIPRSRGGSRSSMLSGLSREVTGADHSTNMKKEPGTKRSKAKDKDGDVFISGGSVGSRVSARVKKEREDFTRESSDDDILQLEPVGRKINIEEINLISEDELSDGIEERKGNEMEKSLRLAASSFMRPVRIGRHEHEERTIAVNTEASSLTSAELRRRAKARGQAEGSLFLPGTPDAMKDRTSKGKGKAKDRDVEFVKYERVWQGVYQDDDGENLFVKIKEEPKDDGNAMALDDGSSPSQTVTQATQAQPETALPPDSAAPVTLPGRTASPSTAPQPSTKSKENLRESKALIRRKPILQTEEDHQEWLRYKQDVVMIEEHLLIPTVASSDPNAEKIRETQQTTVYLFQLPPILPDIEDPKRQHEGMIRRRPAETPSETEKHDAPSTTQDDTSQPKTNSDPKPKPTTEAPPVKAEP
ncbi:MAG: hypothetical protein Q9200_005093, partial [Gallowayella weberi]